VTNEYVFPVLRGKILICSFGDCGIKDIACRSAKHCDGGCEAGFKRFSMVVDSCRGEADLAE